MNEANDEAFDRAHTRSVKGDKTEAGAADMVASFGIQGLWAQFLNNKAHRSAVAVT